MTRIKMFIRAFIDYIRSSVAELQKVTWPTRKEVITYTVLIVISVVVATLILSVVDYGLGYLVNHFLIK